MIILKEKPKPGSAFRKHTMYRVLMRNQKPGPTHGKWEPIARDGFTIVCQSLLEVYELMWMVGPKVFNLPSFDDDMQQAEYMLKHCFRVEPYDLGGYSWDGDGICRRAWAMSMAQWRRGWVPGPEDLKIAMRTPGVDALRRMRAENAPGYRPPMTAGDLVSAALAAKWANR